MNITFETVCENKPRNDGRTGQEFKIKTDTEN